MSLSEKKESWVSLIESALALHLSYSAQDEQKLLMDLNKPLIPAAVLLLFGFNEEKMPSILFVRRTETVETHKGQMAFPGGHCEEDDQDCPDGTALRETHEEVGIPPDQISVLGRLPSLATVSGYWIQPVVGMLNCKIEDILFRLDAEEIAEALWVSIETLTTPGIYRQEKISVGSREHFTHVYQVDSYRIWGATGSMLKNLLDRIQSLS